MPFDIGLRGSAGPDDRGVASDVDWSIFVDFGLNKDGPYLRTSGPKSFAGGEAAALPNGENAPAADTAITGAENKAHRPPNADGPDDDDDDGEPDGNTDPDELPDDAWSDINYLQDDAGGTFTGNVEPGMWLCNLDTDLGLPDLRGRSRRSALRRPVHGRRRGHHWHQTAADDGEQLRRHRAAPAEQSTTADGGSSELNL